LSLLREKSVLSAIETVGCRPPAPHPRPSSSFGTTIIMSSGWLCANGKKIPFVWWQCDGTVTELWWQNANQSCCHVNPHIRRGEMRWARV
jgi:hypothetical protein